MKKASKILLLILMTGIFIVGCNKNKDVLYSKDGISIKIEDAEELNFVGKEIDDLSYWVEMYSEGDMTELKSLAKTSKQSVIHKEKGYFVGVGEKDNYSEEEKELLSKFETYKVTKNKWIVASADINYTEQNFDTMKKVIQEYIELNNDIKIKEGVPEIEVYPDSVNEYDTDYKVMIAIQ